MWTTEAPDLSETANPKKQRELVGEIMCNRLLSLYHIPDFTPNKTVSRSGTVHCSNSSAYCGVK